MGINPYAPGPDRAFGKVFADPRCRDAYDKCFGAKMPFSAFDSVLVYSPDRPTDLVLRSRITPEIMGGNEACRAAFEAFYSLVAGY